MSDFFDTGALLPIEVGLHRSSGFIVCGFVAEILPIGVDDFVAMFYFKDSVIAFDVFGFEIEFGEIEFRQPGGVRHVVSADAIFDSEFVHGPILAGFIPIASRECNVELNHVEAAPDCCWNFDGWFSRCVSYSDESGTGGGRGGE